MIVAIDEPGSKVSIVVSKPIGARGHFFFGGVRMFSNVVSKVSVVHCGGD